MKLYVLNALACMLLTCSQFSLADDLYRCGNSYQDKPCRGTSSSNVTTKKVQHTKKTQAVKESQNASAVDANCKRRGEAAKAIARLREAGKTQDQQINATSDTASQALIKEVYSHRSSALQVQYAFEHECMQLIEKERLTHMQMAESQKLRNSSDYISTNKKSRVATSPTEQAGQLMAPRQASSPAQASTKLQTVKTTPITQPSAITTTTEPKVVKAKPTENPQDEGDVLGICRSFKAGIANIANEKLKGGNAAHMKDLNQQQVHLKQEMKSSGC
jgi:hypothetical protein